MTLFPTPRPVIEQMLARANIQPGMTILEPSAGKGDIADAPPDVKRDLRRLVETVKKEFAP